MASSDGYQLANPNTGAYGLPVVAGTPASVAGGRYVFAASSSNWSGGSVSLQFLNSDGVTWEAASNSTTLLANGTGVVDLPPGQYRAAVTGSPAALYASLSRVIS